MHCRVFSEDIGGGMSYGAYRSSRAMPGDFGVGGSPGPTARYQALFGGRSYGGLLCVLWAYAGYRGFIEVQRLVNLQSLTKGGMEPFQVRI